MAPTSQAPAAAPRTRPKSRRADILQAAGEAFSARGYHQVSLGDVAAAVGVSAPALYRHFPNKYALFLATVHHLVEGLLAATDLPADPATDLSAGPADDADDAAAGGPDPAARLDAVLRAALTTTVTNRRRGGLYRWEGRYLRPEDRAEVGAQFAELTSRVARPLAALRPGLGPDDLRLLASAALSVLASITAHRTALAPRPLADLLLPAAWAALESGLPPAAPGPPPPAPAGAGTAPSSTRERIIVAALGLFHRRGYHEASLEEIGQAVGVAPSAVYRHFDGKAAVLFEACYRSADRLGAATSAALASSTDPREQLAALCSGYVRHSFAHHDLMSAYFSDVGNLDPADQVVLRAIQREHVATWVDLVRGVRDDVSVVEARFLVHAALGVVVDLGRLLRFDSRDATCERVAVVVRRVVGLPG